MPTPMRWFVFVAYLVCSRGIGAEPAVPKTDNPEATAAKHVVRLLENESLGKWVIDDARAKQLLQSFIARLDPHKLICLQSDWMEFQEQEKLLDDQLRAGDLSFVKQVYRRFHLRAGEAHQLAMGALEQKHDFTTDDVWPFPCDDFARDKAALAERWRLRLKGEILFEKANDSTLEEAKMFLRERYENSDLYRRCLTEDYLESSFIDKLCNTCDGDQGYYSPDEQLQYNNKTVRGPKYTLNLLLVPVHFDRPCIRGLGYLHFATKQTPTVRTADLPNLINWEVVAIRTTAGKTHHLVGIWQYEPWAFARAIAAVGDSPEVVLELQHPATLQRKSVAWTQSEKTKLTTNFAHFAPLKPQPQSVLIK